MEEIQSLGLTGFFAEEGLLEAIEEAKDLERKITKAVEEAKTTEPNLQELRALVATELPLHIERGPLRRVISEAEWL